MGRLTNENVALITIRTIVHLVKMGYLHETPVQICRAKALSARKGLAPPDPSVLVMLPRLSPPALVCRLSSSATRRSSSARICLSSRLSRSSSALSGSGMLLLPRRVKLFESGELLSSEALQRNAKIGWHPTCFLEDVLVIVFCSLGVGI